MYVIIWREEEEVDCIGVLDSKSKVDMILKTIKAIQKRLAIGKTFECGPEYKYTTNDAVINHFTDEEKEVLSWLKQDYFLNAANSFCVSVFDWFECPLEHEYLIK